MAGALGEASPTSSLGLGPRKPPALGPTLFLGVPGLSSFGTSTGRRGALPAPAFLWCPPFPRPPDAWSPSFGGVCQDWEPSGWTLAQSPLLTDWLAPLGPGSHVSLQPGQPCDDLGLALICAVGQHGTCLAINTPTPRLRGSPGNGSLHPISSRVCGQQAGVQGPGTEGLFISHLEDKAGVSPQRFFLITLPARHLDRCLAPGGRLALLHPRSPWPLPQLAPSAPVAAAQDSSLCCREVFPSCPPCTYPPGTTFLQCRTPLPGSRPPWLPLTSDKAP